MRATLCDELKHLQETTGNDREQNNTRFIFTLIFIHSKWNVYLYDAVYGLGPL